MTPEETEKFEKLWDRVTWLLKLQSSDAEQRLRLSERVAKNSESIDRLVDSLLLARQRLTEIYDQREDLRAGLEHVNKQLAVISKDIDDADRAARHNTPAYIKVFDRFARAPTRVQIAITVIVVSLAIAGLLHTIVDTLAGH